MIQQILIISCEKQPYRRAGQLAMLEYFGYPIREVDIVWADHRDDYPVEHFLNALSKMGITKHLGEASIVSRLYSLSKQEAWCRTLLRVINDGKNTILLEDDAFLSVPKLRLKSHLQDIELYVGPIDCLQLFAKKIVGDTSKADSASVLIQGTRFKKGICATGQEALFLSPNGASALYELIKRTGGCGALETLLPKHFCESETFFTVLNGNYWVHVTRALQGTCTGTLLAETPGVPKDKHKKPERVAYQQSIMERFRLC